MSDLALGARESLELGRIYVNLRIGKIAKTEGYPKGSPEDVEAKIADLKRQGFAPAKTVNKSGDESHFFAKGYDDITGYVTDIRWHSKTFTNGGEQNGWNITIDTTNEVFVLFISTNERPYHRTMSTLLSADFDKPVRFVGFMGEYQGQKQKVLLVSQEMGADGKPIWLKPLYPERWMSSLLRDKIREQIPLTDKERGNVAFGPDDQPDNTYPYILQKSDGKWSFDTWDDFLVQKMKDEVIPNAKDAANRRGSGDTQGYSGMGDAYESPETNAPAASAEPPEDDIPF